MSRPYTRWTTKLVEALEAYRTGHSSAEIAAYLNANFGATTTAWAVAKRLYKSGIVRNPRWTPGERAIVRAELSKTILACRSRLARRTGSAIAHEIVDVLILRGRKKNLNCIA